MEIAFPVIPGVSSKCCCLLIALHIQTYLGSESFVFLFLFYLYVTCGSTSLHIVTDNKITIEEGFIKSRVYLLLIYSWLK